MAELDPFENFPQFDPSVLSFSDPNLFPDGDFPSPECFGSDLNLDDIDVDLDFSIDDLFLPQSEENPNGSSPNPQSNSNSNSNLTTDSNSNSNSNPGSPESGNASIASGVGTHQHLKRKMDDDDNDNDRIGNPNPSPVNRKRRSDEVNSSCTFSAAATEEDEKRKARLMRNRESAQLSRQRKKHHVEELVEKVKAMSSTIANLNGKISFYMAENARLQQQLNGNSGNGSNTNVNGNAVYPLPPPPYLFPWVPYAMRPSGAPVPYLPIPRLKPQQPAAAPKAKKPENKKSKTKKVASVSLFGVLLVMMLFAGVMNLGFGGSREKGNGIVLSVNGHGRGCSLNNTQESGPCSGKIGSNNWSGNNSCEGLPTFLYVPRNGKHVEINGNLIIHSVLAGEKAMAEAKSKGQEKQLSDNRGIGLAIPDQVPSPLAVSNGAVQVERHPGACRNSSEHLRALSSDSHIRYGDSMQSTLSDGPLQQWFREGLAGPILSSGTCTEIFQFEVSPSGIVPATTVVNVTETLPPGNIKNRRILYGHQIPPNGSVLNNTQHFAKPAKPTESSNRFNTNNNSASSMVVSVLVDPREAGDGDGNRMITPKSVSRIFVVVLVDSVKHVTYSCMLPLKLHAPLVNKL